MTDTEWIAKIARWNAEALANAEPDDEPFDPYTDRVSASYELAGTWSTICPHGGRVNECQKCGW